MYNTVKYKYAETRRASLRILCFLICLCTLMPFIPIQSGAATQIPTEASVKKSISDTYDWARRYNNGESFKNYCAHYVNLQLMLLEINKKYIGGNGNDEYDTYKDMAYTAGGRKVHAYPATNATLGDTLRSLSALGDVVTDVLVGFQWTNTSAGKRYGHVFLIRAIIGEYVYFSDSFGFATNDGTVYKEGQPIKWTIDQLVRFYANPNAYTVEGVIWFEDQELTATLDAAGRWYGEDGGEIEQPPTVDPEPVTDLGEYEITYSAGMRLREGPGQSYSTLEIMPFGTEIFVTEIKNGWGYTYYKGKLGWCCLPGYTEKTGELPPFSLDQYVDSAFVKRTFHSTLSSALAGATETGTYNYTVSAYSNVKLSQNVKLGDGITLLLGSRELELSGFSFTLSGGIVRSAKSVPALKAISLITETLSDGTYVYTSFSPEMAFTSARLVLKDNVALRFTARVEGVSSMKNVSVVMIATDSSGIVTEYAPDSSLDGEYIFTTDGIPPKELADKLTVTLCIRSSSLGAEGEIRGGQIAYSPADYVKASYGSGAILDNLLAAMLNYGTEAQNYFHYNSSLPANSVLPEDVRNIVGDSSVLIRANAAPIVSGNSSVHVNRAQLVLLDNIALRLQTTENTKGSELSLLVWSEADYLALKARADAAGGDISDLLVKGNETRILSDEEGSFTLGDIAAKEFADTYYFRLCQTDGEKTTYDYVFSYSVTSYCADKVSDGIDEDIDSLCMAIALYSAAAREYFEYEINSGK